MLHPETLWGVLVGTLPDHLGHLVALAVPVGLVALALDKSPLRSRRRWLALCTAGVFGFFCLTVLLSSYAPDHNLFWKWSIASTPFLVLCAAHVVVGLLRAVWNQLGINEARSAKTLVPIGLLCTLGPDERLDRLLSSHPRPARPQRAVVRNSGTSDGVD